MDPRVSYVLASRLRCFVPGGDVVDHRALCELGSVEALLRILQHTRNTHTAKHALGALVNLTTERDIQATVVKHGVHLVFQFARAHHLPFCQVCCVTVIVE